ncbi:aldo/keto reductase [Rhizobium vallis]|nr:aldo/keto reductase [Rhizobium vallis]
MLTRTELGSLSVSNMAFGAMYLGTKTNHGTSMALLDTYLAAGGNFIDTADNYTFWVDGGKSGDSERLIGEWLANRGGRDKLVIATKVGARPTEEGAFLDKAEGLSYEAIILAAEMSLENLGTDYIDLYYAHVDDRTVPIEETLRAFDHLVRAGKVREIACSNYTAWRVEQARATSAAHGFASYVAIQHRHSFFKPAQGIKLGLADALGERGGHGVENVVGSELIDYVEAHPGFRIVAYSPLLQGGVADPNRLAKNYLTADNNKRRTVLEEIVAETGATANQIVLAWMMATRSAVIPLVAASKLNQLEENLKASKVILTAEQLDKLNEAA